MRKLLPKILDFTRRADMVLFTLCMICAILGLIVIDSASATLENPARFVIVQTVCLLIGVGLFVLFTIIDLDIIADKWIILVAFEIALLLALFIFGEDDGTGNKAWIRFGAIGVQPSEVIKVVFIVVMAKHIAYLKNYKNLNSIISMGQLMIHCVMIVGMLVVISGDLGSALVYLFVFIAMIFAAEVKFYWFLIGFAGIAAFTPVFWTQILKDYHRDRIMAPYVATIDPLEVGIKWQSSQSKIALANGQTWGTGLYNGPITQSLKLPEKQTDFIFSVIGEELGMIACIAVFALLMAIIIRCIYIGIKSRNTMSMLVCFGVAGSLIFQTFENIGMCIGIAPIIGITLPFLSYGGSSMFSMLAAVGLVSGVKYRPKPERFVSYR